jgi:hypothetical protein
MNQILSSAYYENKDKWDKVARDQGGLEICDDTTGEPIYTISGY